MSNFNFKEWIFNEGRGSGLNGYIRNGKIKMFHYSFHQEPIIKLDPNRFGSNSFTQREKRTAISPRIFFYLDLRDRENFFDGRTLYQTEVLANEIYDLSADPQKFNKNGPNIDYILSLIKNAGYKGIYTLGRGFHCVEWFYPIVVKLTSEIEELKNYFNTDWNKIAKERDEEKELLKKKQEKEEAERLRDREEDQARQDAWWAAKVAQRKQKAAV